MKSNKRVATVALAATCALGGAAAGISESSAAKGSSSTNKTTRNATAAVSPGHWPGGPHGPGGPGGFGGFGGFGGRDVHSVEVVLNKAGSAYIEETRDSGTITALDSSGATITLKEGTTSVTYATPTIKIPSGATIILDGASSSLEKLAVGDEVTISSSSEGTMVFATDSSFKPSGVPGMGDGAPPAGAPSPPVGG